MAGEFCEGHGAVTVDRRQGFINPAGNVWGSAQQITAEPGGGQETGRVILT